MKKDKTMTASEMAKKRWAGVSPEERTAHQRAAAQTPRTAKRCFCGASSMLRAAERYFDCCRKAGVIVLNLKAREAQDEPESQSKRA